MNTTQLKRLPYGTSDFRRIRVENYAYVDKTRFIEMLELENNPSHFFIRPRKFGKSLFFSMLSYYYDINYAEQFEQLFGDLYIGQHPTPEKNSHAILEFDFSGLDTSNEEKFTTSFSAKIQDAVRLFLNRYTNIFKEANIFINQIDSENPGVQALNKVFNVARANNIKIYVIIDEYDHFANDLIAMGNRYGKDFYKMMITANGLVRDFYENLKIATKSSIVNRTFITGISPVMLDDLTSGYNIGNNLTLKQKYNEMMGFTSEEVFALMKNTGVDADLIKIDMERYYNGYLFHERGANRVYNPSMILYFFEQILEEGVQPEKIIDPNLTTDYGRLQRLTQNDHNRDILIQILKEGGIVSEILDKFSIDRLQDDRYFISLLFYMGLITIKEPYMGMVCLGSPNYSIQTIYWEYMMQLVQDHSPEMTVRRDGGVAYHPSEIFIADDVATCSECGAIIAEVTPLSINDAYYCPDCYCKKIKKINDSYEKHYDQSRKANETIVMCQCCLRWLCDDEIDHYAFGNVCPECLEEFFDEEKIKNFRL